MLVNIARNADTARIGQPLHSRGYVDTIAVEVAPLHDDIAEAYANAEFEAFVLGQRGVALGECALDRNRAVHGIDGTGELGKRAIAGDFEDASAELGNRRRENFAAQRLEPFQCTDLVRLHQPRIAPRPPWSSSAT